MIPVKGAVPHERVVFAVGLLACIFYIFWIKPAGTGFNEDFCFDLPRQLMAENLAAGHGIRFWSDSVFAPTGAWIPFMSWAIERDGLGALLWNWNSSFPFAWVYTAASLLLVFFISGSLLRSWYEEPAWKKTAWLLATALVILNLPRHFKTWHHFEHLGQHSWTLLFLADATLWKRWIEKREISALLVSVRIFAFLAVFNLTGYFWGPAILETYLLSIFFGGAFFGAIFLRRKASLSSEYTARARLSEGWRSFLQGARRHCALIVLCGVGSLALLAVQLPWFSALHSAASQFPWVHNGIGWGAMPWQVFRPVWLEMLMSVFGSPLQNEFWRVSETVVSIGWFYLAPLFLFIGLSLRAKRGLRVAWPWIALFVVLFLYVTLGEPRPVARLIQKIVPTMEYFRVASRLALYFPLLAVIVIASLWPRFWAHYERLHPTAKRAYLFIWLGIGLLEAAWWVKLPARQMDPLSQENHTYLERVKAAPGDMVLSMPFCSAGGNDACLQEQCTGFPHSTISQCLRLWHGKKVFGLYQARMGISHCEIYKRPPYEEWFRVWNENRCLDQAQWKAFCEFLEAPAQQGRLAVIQVLPDLWPAIEKPECARDWVRHLGEPLDQTRIRKHVRRSVSWLPSWQFSAYESSEMDKTLRIINYAPRCKRDAFH